MLTALSLAGCGDIVVDAGVEEVNAAVEDAATEGGQGDKLDDRWLRVLGWRLPRAPCTAKNVERCPHAVRSLSFALQGFWGTYIWDSNILMFTMFTCMFSIFRSARLIETMQINVIINSTEPNQVFSSFIESSYRKPFSNLRRSYDERALVGRSVKRREQKFKIKIERN